jgi:Uma2 family endonuclease
VGGERDTGRELLTSELPMAQLAPHHRFTFADYVQIEEHSGIRHEFLDGIIFALAGGTPEHAAIAANVTRLLGNALEGQRCRVFSSDLRIRVVETGLASYPDVSVICGKVELDPEDPKGHTALNPVVLVEVLSPSTEDYDRGEKLAQYRRVPSLQEVVLVAHDERRIDLWRRVGDHWTQISAGPGATLTLESVGCGLAVDEVYRDPLAG